MDKDWLRISEALNCGNYNEILKNKKSYIPWHEKGYLETTELKVKEVGKNLVHLKVSDLDQLLAFTKELKTNYLIENEVKEVLGMQKTQKGYFSDKLIAFCKIANIDYKYFEQGFLFNGYWHSLFVNKNDLLNFLKTHITHGKARERYNLTHQQINALVERYDISRIFFHSRFSFYKTEDAENYFVELYDENIHYEFNEALSILGLNTNPTITFYNILDSEGIENIKIGRKTYFLKTEIDGLVKKMQDIRIKYCTRNDVTTILNVKRFPQNTFTPVAVNSLSRMALGDDKRVKFMFSREEVHAYKREVELRESISTALDSEPVDGFLKINDLKGISFAENSTYTKTEWFEYCISKLKLSNASKTRLKNTVSEMILCTEYLVDLIREKELYALSSKEITLKIFNDVIPRRHQFLFYSFLTEYHAKVNFFLTNESIKKKTFDLSKIPNPRNYETEEQTKETYQYDEYLAVYDYAKEAFHKEKAIRDAENILSKNSPECYYASSWLYVLTHLGNAWRHGDVMDLSIIDLNQTSVSSLEDLKHRDLTTEEAISIVNQVKRKDFVVNKTKAVNKFNCPDDLILSFATAITICSLIAQNTNGIIMDSNGNLLNGFAIDFNTKNRNEFTQKAHTAFFEAFSLEDFQFQSRKMNRTILVLMYMILVQKGKGSAALEVAQRLRAHEDFESTNIYLVIPDDELDKICENLFNRKPFGYITDLMATILLGDNDNREERTEDIVVLNNTFGGSLQIEATSGFINKTIAERNKVADQIFEMGLEKVTTLMFDLHTNTLPSHEENFQCITSPNCQKPELDSCKDCPFAVPNFYAISSLVESIKSTIREFVAEFDVEAFDGEKTRLMNLLYKDMDHLENAIQKFGQTEVFRFFENGEDEYNGLLELLDEIQNKTGEDMEKFLTYKPVYLD